jgi:cobalt-zinc-cadmium efflux system membrane fusion protein
VVEKDAVQVLDNEHVVFVSEGLGRFRPVEVEVGDSDSLFTIILSGLEEGTEYAVAGAFELKAKIVTSSLSGHAGHGH